MRRIAPSILLLPLLLGACTETAIGALDEKVSQWTDMECSTMLLALGEGYCRDRVKPGDRPAAKLHCFRTLGGVDCYSVADPYGLNGTGRTRQATRLTEPAPPVRVAADPDAAP